MTNYLFASFFGICILLCFVGWGTLLNRVLFTEAMGMGRKASLGVAFSVFTGGILNLVALISRTIILAYIITGVLLWLFHLIKNKGVSRLKVKAPMSRQKKTACIVYIILALLTFSFYFGWVSTKRFNKVDDYQGYFVFPLKMLQTGAMGADPFSERKTVTSLGGQSYLHTFVLCALPEKNLNLIDPAIAFVIAVAVLLEYIRKKKISHITALFILLFFMIMPFPKANITTLVMAVPLFFTLYLTLDRENVNTLSTATLIKRAVAIGLLLSTLMALKSLLIPACFVFTGMFYFISLIKTKEKKHVFIESLLVILATGLCLAPWMTAMYRSSGTFLYPLLGKGFHGAVYGTFASPWQVSFGEMVNVFSSYICSDFFVLFLLSNVGYFIFLKNETNSTGTGGSERSALLSAAMGAGLGAVIMVMATQGITRYAYPFLIAATLLLMVNILGTLENMGKMKTVCLVLLILYLFPISFISRNFPKINRRIYSAMLNNYATAFSEGPLLYKKNDVSRYVEMQNCIPRGDTVLTRLSKPFLLDFRRNKIFIMDYPGGASLPPGMPFFQGSDALARYLSGKSIRYVAYSYWFDRTRQKNVCGQMNHTSVVWEKTHIKHTLDFFENIMELSHKRKKIYDDGKMFVLDLEANE